MEELKQVLARLRDQARSNADDVEPWQSFWYYRPHLDFPPRSIRHVEEYDGSARLALACTQTGLPARDHKRLVEQWCELLPALGSVRYLWLTSRAPQELFDAACAMKGLEGLYIKWSGVTSSRALAQLQTLRYLHVGSSPSFAPLDVFRELPQLRWLELENVKAASDPSFVQPLRKLAGLSLTGDTNSIKVLKLETLRPLAALDELEWLQLVAVTLVDESLAVLGNLPSLKYLHLANAFPMEEIARLAARLPHARCNLFRPFSEPRTWSPCKRCGGYNVVMLTGKGKPWLCTVCDADRVERHEAAWRAAQRGEC